MAFMDPEKGIAALQTLQMGGASKDFFVGLGTAAKAVGYNEMVNVSERIQSLHGAESAERFLIKQGLIEGDDLVLAPGKHSA